MTRHSGADTRRRRSSITDWVHHSADYVDWSQARRVSLPRLKPSTQTILLRLPEALLDRIKFEANKRDVPYQPLIKAWLAEDLQRKSSG